MNSFNKFNLHKRIIDVMIVYLFLSFSACVMAVFRKLAFGDAEYTFLIWNLFLAWIPLILSGIITYTYTFKISSLSRTIYILVLGFGWIIFYPNSPYLVTDFIHLSGIKYYFNNVGYRMNFIIWYDFIMISLFILTGFLLGFISLYMIQKLIIDKFNDFFGWVFVTCILFLSSFAVYLGRFIRFNSWDIIFNPSILINSIIESSKHYAIEFSISFGLFLILIYVALYYLTKLNESYGAFLRIGEPKRRDMQV